jgi:hypothetical protein
MWYGARFPGARGLGVFGPVPCVAVRILKLSLVALLSTVAVPVSAGLGAPSVAHAAPLGTTAYLPLPTPQRLLDTRDTGGPLGAGDVVTIAVTGDAPLPSAATTRAVVVNITVVGPAAVGFWTTFPHGRSIPTASNLNIDERASALGGGLAMSNLVTVPVGDNGSIDVFSQSGGQLVVDMLGSYQASDATAAGRFVPLATPTRIVDTRSFLPVFPDTSIDIPVPGGAGAAAAVLNVTTIANGAGYWTLYATGSGRPVTTNLNSLYPFHIVANQVIVPLDAAGSFSMYGQTGGHVVVDLIGLITGPDAAVGTDGLFVPLDSPTRFLDTRERALNPLGSARMLLPGWNVEVPVATNPAVGRRDVAAVVMNLTTTESLGEGYATVSPAGTNNPALKARGTSTLNVARAAQVLPNHATVAVSARGFDVFSQRGGHVIADVAGYYLGAPVAAPYGQPANSDPTPLFCVGFPTSAVAPVVVGSSRGTVMRAQQRLLDLGFWLDGVDGDYGWTTSQAVMAFQKWAGIPASSAVTDATAAALNTTLCRPVPTITTGDLFEVDKGRQLGIFVRGGKLLWVINISTGGNYAYQAIDQKTGGDASGIAITPVGSFKVYRFADDPAYKGSLGTLYRPRFFTQGIAVHGYRSVPNFPASHGCVRVSNPAMDMIWGMNLLPMGSKIVVHD